MVQDNCLLRYCGQVVRSAMRPWGLLPGKRKICWEDESGWNKWNIPLLDMGISELNQQLLSCELFTMVCWWICQSLQARAWRGLWGGEKERAKIETDCGRLGVLGARWWEVKRILGMLKLWGQKGWASHGVSKAHAVIRLSKAAQFRRVQILARIPASLVKTWKPRFGLGTQHSLPSPWWEPGPVLCFGKGLERAEGSAGPDAHVDFKY